MSSSLGPIGDFIYRAKVDTGGTVTAQVIKPFEVSDVVLRCTAAHALGTIQLQRSLDNVTFNNVTDSLICAADGVQTRSSTVVTAQAVFAAGDYMRALVTNSAEGIAYINISPMRIPGQ